jgi:hypothetical protein
MKKKGYKMKLLLHYTCIFCFKTNEMTNALQSMETLYQCKGFFQKQTIFFIISKYGTGQILNLRVGTIILFL